MLLSKSIASCITSPQRIHIKMTSVDLAAHL